MFSDLPFFGRGFRPFFAMGAMYAVAIVALWVAQLRGAVFVHTPFADPVLWHAHEMVYGFTLAIIAGFLLTAVANWTGGETAKGGRLAALCLLWLAGRVAMNVPCPYPLAAMIDLAFVPALAVVLSIPLIRSRNKRNFIFLGMLGLLFACNLAVWIMQDRVPIFIALIAIMGIISAIGGRVIPAFTVSGLRRRGLIVKQTDQRKTDAAALILLAALALAVAAVGVQSWLTGGLALAAAFVHGWRHRYYHLPLVWRDPMLWTLHAGHLWLTLGLALVGVSAFGLLPLSPALHALTVGAIGTLTLSMMCRVALGHTGRPIEAGRATLCAFILMQGAAIVRVVCPIVHPAFYTLAIEASAALWVLAFLVYIPVYVPVLWRKRPDGLPA